MGRGNIVIVTIDNGTAVNLHIVSVVCRFFHFDGRHILKFILRERHLQDDKAGVAICLLDNPDKIGIAIFIQIEIIDAGFRIIEISLKGFQIFRILK